MAAPYVHDPPLPAHLNIVALESYFTRLPPMIVPAPHTFTVTEHSRTAPEEVAARIADADIVITTVVPIRADVLAAANSPRLRLIAVMASGTDAVDLAACSARGIRVLNSPNCNTVSLAEHVAALYLSCRRSLVPVMRSMCRDEWPKTGSLMTNVYTCGVPPRGCRDETLAIIGYGGVGQAVANLLGGLGMKVIVAARRGAGPPSPSSASAPASGTATPDRVPFEEALQRATVLVVCCPRLPETLNLIGSRELALMRPDAILINVSRGGVVTEESLVAALREGRLAGAGVDVFNQEPASTQTSPVVAAAAVGDLNLVTSAHTAWVSASTNANYQRCVQENVERFVRGTMDAERVRA